MARRTTPPSLASLAPVLAAGSMAMLPLVAMPLPAFAQAYPSKPVRLIVPVPAGGVLDRLSRSIAPRAAETFGQPVLVENRPGASTILGTEAVARAPADGHTLLMMAAARSCRSTRNATSSRCR